MILGIDASNISSGGGLTHLREVLSTVEPIGSGISAVVVWACRKTLDCLPARKELRLIPTPDWAGTLPGRVFWQAKVLHQSLARQQCNALLVPGGTYLGRFRPFVAICQNLLPFCSKERARFGCSWPRLRYHLLEWSQSNTFRLAQGVIFLTTAASRLCLNGRRCPEPNYRIIPLGISERFRAQPRPQRPLSAYSAAAPFRCLYVSTISWYKHQDNLARAVALLRSRGLPLAFDFVGPAHRPALRHLQRVLQRLDPHHTFLRYHGPIPFAEVRSWYLAADAFIFASSCENMPNILLEAMAVGLPIACSNAPPMPAILGDAGAYFNPEDAQDIARVLALFAGDPDCRARCAHRAFDRALAYTWNKCARLTFDFVAEVCTHHHATAPARP